MNKQIFLLAIMVFGASFMLSAQEYEFGFFKEVNSKNGLTLYTQATSHSEKIITIPQNAIVYYLMKIDQEGQELDPMDIINNKEGNWRQVYFNGAYGYAFDADLLYAENTETTKSYIYSVLSHDTPIYKENNNKSEVLFKVPKAKTVYVFDPNTLPKTDGNSRFIKVRYKDYIGYIDSPELINFDEGLKISEEMIMDNRN